MHLIFVTRRPWGKDFFSLNSLSTQGSWHSGCLGGSRLKVTQPKMDSKSSSLNLDLQVTDGCPVHPSTAASRTRLSSLSQNSSPIRKCTPHFWNSSASKSSESASLTSYILSPAEWFKTVLSSFSFLSLPPSSLSPSLSSFFGVCLVVCFQEMPFCVAHAGLELTT